MSPFLRDWLVIFSLMFFVGGFIIGCVLGRASMRRHLEDERRAADRLFESGRGR